MLSRQDREEVAELERASERFRLRAEAELDDDRSARLARSSRRLARLARVRRIYPLTVWLWGAAAVVVVTPWAVLNRVGDGTTGVVASGVVGILLLGLRRRRTHRERLEGDATPPS